MTGVMHICGPRSYRLVSLRTHRVAWCFRCRKHRAHMEKVEAPTDIEDMMWGPIARVYCAACGLTDGDMFPGRWREWDF